MFFLSHFSMMFQGYTLFFRSDAANKRFLNFLESEKNEIVQLHVSDCNFTQIFSTSQVDATVNATKEAVQAEESKRHDQPISTEVACKLMRIKKKMHEALTQLNQYKRKNGLLEANISVKRAVLQELNDEIETVITGDQINYHENVPERQKDVIYDLIVNSTCHPDPRGYEYSSTTLEMAYIVYSHSPVAYEALRHFLPLPCETTIKNHFSITEDIMTECILDHEKALVPLIAADYPLLSLDEEDRDVIACNDANEPVAPELAAEQSQSNKKYTLNGEEEPRISIALDAISLKLWSTVSKTDEDFNNLFIFLGMPLNFDASNVALHAIPHTNGSAGEKIRTKVKEVIEGVNNHIRVSYVITDGDYGYNEFDDVFFDFWFNVNLTTDQMIERAEKYCAENIVYIRDIIHLAKNLRAWLLNDKKIIITSPIDSTKTAKPSEIRNVIKIGDALDDLSHIGKMKDRYAITLFSLQVLAKCFDNNLSSEFLFLLPLSFVFEAIRNEKFDQETRLNMLRLSLEVVITLIRNCKIYNLGNQIPATEDDDNSTTTHYFATLWHLKNMASAIMVFIIELHKNPFLNFSHLTTLTEEHFNGLIRTMCHYKFDYFSTVHIIAKLNNLLLLKDENKFPSHPKRRGDSAGIQMDPDNCSLEIKTPEFFLEMIECMLSACGNCPPGHDSSSDEAGIQVFSKYLHALLEHATPIKISEFENNQLASQMILNRILQNHAKKE